VVKEAGVLDVSTAVRSIDNDPQCRQVRRTTPPPASLLGPNRWCPIRQSIMARRRDSFRRFRGMAHTLATESGQGLVGVVESCG